MAKAKGVHVVKSGNGWAAKQGGRTISKHRTQANAAKSGRSVAKKGKTELYVHGTNGRIRAANSYGKDPSSSKG